jgi:hypothetical protein
MTKFICLHCGHHFDGDEIVAKHYDRATGTWDSEECPNCGSEDFEEAAQCPICKEWFSDDDMRYGVCESCIDSGVTKRNAFRYGSANSQELAINGFMAWVYSLDNIEHILEEHFKSESDEWQKRMATEYCHSDKYSFAEWMEENNDAE